MKTGAFFECSYRFFSFIAITLIAICIPGMTDYSAQSVRLRAALEAGGEDKEAAQRASRDTLLAGFSFGRLEIYDKTSGYAAMPIEIGLDIPAGEGALYLGLGLAANGLEHEYTAISTCCFATGSFQNYGSGTSQLLVGYRIQLGAWSLMPKIGSRGYAEQFEIEETSFSASSIRIDTSSEWNSEAGGTTIGIDLEYALNDRFSITAGLESARLTGTFEGRNQGLTIGRNAFALDLVVSNASYETTYNVFRLGGRYRLNEQASLIGGISSVSRTVSYPGHFSFEALFVSNTGGVIGLDLEEYLLDRTGYGASRTSAKTGIFAGIEVIL